MIVCTISLGKYSIELANIAKRRMDCKRLTVFKRSRLQKFLAKFEQYMRLLPTTR